MASSIGKKATFINSILLTDSGIAGCGTTVKDKRKDLLRRQLSVALSGEIYYLYRRTTNSNRQLTTDNE
jgi:hypothetical protein